MSTLENLQFLAPVFDRTLAWCLDLHVDAAPGRPAHRVPVDLLCQTQLRQLEVKGCEVSRAFAPKNIQRLVARGIEVIGPNVRKELREWERSGLAD